MISKQIEEMINNFILVEHNSAYLYLAMSNYLKRLSYTGMAHWLKLHHNEERGHALKLMDYLAARGGIVEIKAMHAQPTTFGSHLETFRKVLEHEQQVTQQYHQAYYFAKQAKDLQTIAIIQEFLKEQIEEEDMVEAIVNRLALVEGNTAGLLIIDQELGKRGNTGHHEHHHHHEYHH